MNEKKKQNYFNPTALNVSKVYKQSPKQSIQKLKSSVTLKELEVLTDKRTDRDSYFKY